MTADSMSSAPPETREASASTPERPERRAQPRPVRRQRQWVSSITAILAASFLVVVLPLLVAIGVALVNVNRLSEEVATALNQSSSLATSAKAIDQHVRELQRHSKQAQLIDPSADDGYLSLLNASARRQEKLVKSIGNALEQIDDSFAEAQLNTLLARSAALVSNVGTNPADPAQDALVSEMFSLSRWWTTYAEARSSEGAKTVQEQAQTTRETLKQMVLVSIPLALFLIVLFTFLISSSLRQITRAIKQLGENRFEERIQVRGPTDLRALGDELDVLRMRLHQAELQKQRFLRHMSHELKTPLASLLEGTELFVDGSLGDLPSAQSEVAGILRSNAQELRHLIENLLDYSAWQSHGGTLRYTEFDLAVLCTQVLDQYRLMMRTREIRVDQRIVPMKLRADRDKLRTVLSNLVSNAIKYTPAKGTIFIRAFRSGRHIMFELADTGPDIPQAERHHVFEPFFTGTPPQQAHLKGSGIGLSLVREYVRAHGGSVELVDGVYRGAHFRILMPFKAHDGSVRLSA